MSRICILTDSTALFPNPVFSGQEHVHIIPLYLQAGDEKYADTRDLSELINHAMPGNDLYPVVHPPSQADFHKMFLDLSARYQEIIVILISSHLSPAIANARVIAGTVKCPALIHITDSQTTAAGLGILVEAAAEAGIRGANGIEITRLVRGLIPRIYTVFCLQSLVALAHSGHLDPAQAIIGEILGVIPFYILESGRLVPIQKARSSRHLVDQLFEFVAEFDHLEHLALLQGMQPYEQEVRNLRERIHQSFPEVNVSEHTLNASLATILGPRSLGLVAMEAFQ